MVRFCLRGLAALCALLLVTACGGRLSPPAAGPGGLTASAAVERFLQLAGAKSYIEMGWVFGTEEGPIIQRDPLPNVERRMYALSNVLAHDSFVVGRGTAVPGRIGAAERFAVRFREGNRMFDVPITAVRGPGGRWFVERVDVEAITNK